MVSSFSSKGSLVFSQVCLQIWKISCGDSHGQRFFKTKKRHLFPSRKVVGISLALSLSEVRGDRIINVYSARSSWLVIEVCFQTAHDLSTLSTELLSILSGVKNLKKIHFGIQKGKGKKTIITSLIML